MKVILVLVVLIGVGGYLLYDFGGYGSFDPSQQGRDAKAAIKPGMSWSKVVDAAGEPREYRVVIEKRATIGGVEEITYKPGPANKFSRDIVTDRVATSDLPHGFIFEYVFSQSVAFAVTFNDLGNVVGVRDMGTMADLLDM